MEAELINCINDHNNDYFNDNKLVKKECWYDGNTPYKCCYVFTNKYANSELKDDFTSFKDRLRVTGFGYKLEYTIVENYVTCSIHRIE